MMLQMKQKISKIEQAIKQISKQQVESTPEKKPTVIRPISPIPSEHSSQSGSELAERRAGTPPNAQAEVVGSLPASMPMRDSLQIPTWGHTAQDV